MPRISAEAAEKKIATKGRAQGFIPNTESYIVSTLSLVAAKEQCPLRPAKGLQRIAVSEYAAPLIVQAVFCRLFRYPLDQGAAACCAALLNTV